MLNKIVLMGRLVSDPELRQTPSGVSVTTFCVAVDRDFKNKETGEKETDFINIQAWRSTAEFVANYFTKGRMAVVEGRLQIRNYTDKEGNKRIAAEVVAESVYFGNSQPKGSDGEEDNLVTKKAAATKKATKTAKTKEKTDDDMEELDVDGDLPF